MDDNRRRMIIKMETLKHETMKSIHQIIKVKSDDRKNNIKNQIMNIIVNAVNEVLVQKGMQLDEEYVREELDVLTAEIEKGNKVLDDNLLARINSVLNRHIESAVDYPGVEERDIQLKRNESRMDNELEEDESQRHRKINNNQIPKIEEFLYNIFSHEMRKVEYRGITLTERDREELKYEILSKLKHRGSEKIADFFDNQNVELIRDIKTKISEFFESIKQELLQQEQQEGRTENKKTWELSAEEMGNINPAKAVEEINKGKNDIEPEELGPIIK